MIKTSNFFLFREIFINIIDNNLYDSLQVKILVWFMGHFSFQKAFK
jgi:hypothetical protein